jgi:hypothetical protein
MVQLQIKIFLNALYAYLWSKELADLKSDKYYKLVNNDYKIKSAYRTVTPSLSQIQSFDVC